MDIWQLLNWPLKFVLWIGRMIWYAIERRR